jgi:hypothetical protein
MVTDWRAASEGIGLPIFPQNDHEITAELYLIFHRLAHYELLRRHPYYELSQSRSIRLRH